MARKTRNSTKPAVRTAKPRQKELAQLYTRNLELAIERDRMCHEAAVLNLILAWVLRTYADGDVDLPDELETNWRCVISPDARGKVTVRVERVEIDEYD